MKKHLTILLLLIVSVAFSQPYTDRVNISATGTYTFPCVLYRSTTAVKLPLIIFLHGTGQAGATDGSQVTKLYQEGLPLVLKNGFIPPFPVVIVAPQHNSYSLDPANLAGVIKDMYLRFKIDTTKIYITGLSAGGRGSYGSQFNISSAFAKKIAAIVPLSGATQDIVKTNFSWTSAPTWAIVGNNDISYRDQNIYMVDEMNKAKPGIAKIDIRSGVGHGGWTEIYNGTWKNAAGQTIWDFLKGKSTVPVPVVPAPVITIPAAFTVEVNKPFTYQVVATNSPTSYTAIQLPTGLSISNTGLISGTPTVVQTNAPQVSATNAGGTGTALFAFTITAPPKVIARELIINDYINAGCSIKITFYTDGSFTEIKL